MVTKNGCVKYEKGNIQIIPTKLDSNLLSQKYEYCINKKGEKRNTLVIFIMCKYIKRKKHRLRDDIGKLVNKFL